MEKGNNDGMIDKEDGSSEFEGDKDGMEARILSVNSSIWKSYKDMQTKGMVTIILFFLKDFSP